MIEVPSSEHLTETDSTTQDSLTDNLGNRSEIPEFIFSKLLSADSIESRANKILGIDVESSPEDAISLNDSVITNRNVKALIQSVRELQALAIKEFGNLHDRYQALGEAARTLLPDEGPLLNPRAIIIGELIGNPRCGLPLEVRAEIADDFKKVFEENVRIGNPIGKELVGQITGETLDSQIQIGIREARQERWFDLRFQYEFAKKWKDEERCSNLLVQLEDTTKYAFRGTSRQEQEVLLLRLNDREEEISILEAAKKYEKCASMERAFEINRKSRSVRSLFEEAKYLGKAGFRYLSVPHNPHNETKAPSNALAPDFQSAERVITSGTIAYSNAIKTLRESNGIDETYDFEIAVLDTQLKLRQSLCLFASGQEEEGFEMFTSSMNSFSNILSSQNDEIVSDRNSENSKNIRIFRRATAEAISKESKIFDGHFRSVEAKYIRGSAAFLLKELCECPEFYSEVINQDPHATFEARAIMNLHIDYAQDLIEINSISEAKSAITTISKMAALLVENHEHYGNAISALKSAGNLSTLVVEVELSNSVHALRPSPSREFALSNITLGSLLKPKLPN